MPYSIIMPRLGESVVEGTVNRWLKALGERVELDEPLVEVVSDKTVAEVPSPAAGILVRITVAEGENVPVESEIAVID
jgi:pyruvate dehydrogenase E2 component (dihydrolipoyllysine-residue acetyltransferase)